jgi:sterol desaturase/sphingolipid hydroxylase (fatty acid hydroxylase superfamily)
MVYISLAISAVIVLVFAWFERRSGGQNRDWVINLQAWLLNIVAGLTVYTLFTAWQGPSLLRGEDLPLWLGIALYILVQDLGEYLFHRAQHRIPFMWKMHSLHHSDPEMSALTTTRHFWGDRLFKTFTVWSLAAMVIAPTTEALLAYFVISFWNYVAHANLAIDFGRWSWVINTPAYHRRHHSRLPEHYDSNFAALFPIWDVVLGSYHRPDGFPPTGLDEQPHSVRDLLLWPLVQGREKLPEASAELPA